MKVKKEATNPILKTLIMTKKVKNANDQVKKKKSRTDHTWQKPLEMKQQELHTLIAEAQKNNWISALPGPLEAKVTHK